MPEARSETLRTRTAECTCPICTLAQRSSLGPPPVGRHRTFSDDADDDLDDKDPDGDSNDVNNDIQACLFYAPHLLHKTWEAGKVKLP